MGVTPMSRSGCSILNVLEAEKETGLLTEG